MSRLTKAASRLYLRRRLLSVKRPGFAPALVLVLVLVLVLAACGGPPRDSSLPLAPTSATALATCLKIAVMRPVCPRRVPLLSSGRVAVVAGCLNAAGSLVPLTSRQCRNADWSVMGRAPIPAFIGHIVISASPDDPQCEYPR